MPVKRRAIAAGEEAHDFQDEGGFDGGKLGFDSAGDVQARGAPVCEGECRAGELRGERDDEEIAGITAEADDNGRTLRKLRSVNGMGSRTRSSREQFIENVVGVVVPHGGQTALGLRQPSGALGVVFQGFD